MTRAKYYEVTLDAVMGYFAKGFTTKEGVAPADIPPEWFVDTGRGLVVFKLFIDDGRPEVESPDMTEGEKK